MPERGASEIVSETEDITLFYSKIIRLAQRGVAPFAGLETQFRHDRILVGKSDQAIHCSETFSPGLAIVAIRGIFTHTSAFTHSRA